ncbi:MAG: alpha/beta hydrolase [Dorea sp.]|nr:alpha/beta hydrolase [Dorea sp.]
MDVQLHYVVRGSGEPLILLHGNGEDVTYFSHQIAFFQKSYQVIAVDTRGHGKSPRGNAPFTISQFADDLYDFMREHDIRRADMLGFSDGANIALLFTIRHPERVNRLILNGANLNPRGLKTTVQFSLMKEFRAAKASADTDDEAYRKMEFLYLMVKEPHISFNELKEVRVPTLVIVGEDDMIKKSHSRKIYNKLPAAKLAVISGNHFIANENFDLFNQEVAKFLEENRKSKE